MVRYRRKRNIITVIRDIMMFLIKIFPGKYLAHFRFNIAADLLLILAGFLITAGANVIPVVSMVEATIKSWALKENVQATYQAPNFTPMFIIIVVLITCCTFGCLWYNVQRKKKCDDIETQDD